MRLNFWPRSYCIEFAQAPVIRWRGNWAISCWRKLSFADTNQLAGNIALQADDTLNSWRPTVWISNAVWQWTSRPPFLSRSNWLALALPRLCIVSLNDCNISRPNKEDYYVVRLQELVSFTHHSWRWYSHSVIINIWALDRNNPQTGCARSWCSLILLLYDLVL